jgi:DNA polymerase III sliding clamp (beta) subunit (PCNA family)
MNPPDWKRCTAEQLWHYLAWHLENAGIGSVLVGGAAVAIHTQGCYRTGNLDLVPDDLVRREVPKMLRSLGFVAQRSRDFVHPECPQLTVRLPMGPVEIGGESPVVPDEVEVHGRRLRLLSPTDCVKDRLASYAHWRSRQFVDQAFLICQHQPGRVDLGQVERWCEAQGASAAFGELQRRLADSEDERFRVVALPAGNQDADQPGATGIRPVTIVSGSELQAARQLLSRLRFERPKSPVASHVLATIGNGALTLAVTDGDHWLETQIPNAADPAATARFLIPAKALADAARAGRGSLVQEDFSGEPGKPLLKITVVGSKAQTRTVHPTEPANAFPERPVLAGRLTHFPKETLLALQAISVCASTDPLRPVINGVLFSPEDGGILVATDGHHLACVPARVPDRQFVLPSAAVHVLGHPDFLSRDVAILRPDDPACPHVQFRSGSHTLIARIITGYYPSWRKVIPDCLSSSATIPEPHRAALVSRLRSLKDPLTQVRLTWNRPGHLTITQQDPGAAPAIFEVPVTTEGHPATIHLRPQPLANALVIGSTIRLRDDLTPCLVTDPSGAFCVLMPMRSWDGDADAPFSVTV